MSKEIDSAGQIQWAEIKQRQNEAEQTILTLKKTKFDTTNYREWI